ncbi:hypothetical protein CPB84DRAFT_1766803 [Gymnopilus junonius]|uniref:Aminoglycoside phosphotransferase domain-containing protein n=1 Tax=Gymnopilus junonius TaxID=109634 RepID=A0A9P5TSW4_GYMJU|nr:hypothetical protein CPB84DRAFT_1766803 [Gymnopilus junonius]
MGVDVGRIKFLSAGEFGFHFTDTAYLITMVDQVAVVARVARRFMPRLKTESEVATIHYLREKTNVPVSTIYHYDSNPYNRLGGEFIVMSKAPGIPLSQVYHGLCYNDLVKLLKNLAAIVIPLFAHRFSAIGSLYFGPDPRFAVTSGAPTPKATLDHYSAFPFSPTLEMASFLNGTTPRSSTTSLPALRSLSREYHVGPIISWPFFGSNRGELTTESYLASCVTREVEGVIRENEGKSAPHRLHLDPVRSTHHGTTRYVPDEWNLSESEDEWEGPGDAMYRDYRRMQRSTFLIAHLSQRVETVKKEMGRWMETMEKLMALLKKEEGPEEFGLDCHDLNCIIDWESTTTRPLWACAHVPSFLQSSPFLTKLFREIIAQLPKDPSISVELPHAASTRGKPLDLKSLCEEWLYYEMHGTRLRLAHRFVEWDGWEEGLIDSILGPEEYENEWFKPSSMSMTEVLECLVDTGSAKGLLSSPGPRGKALQALVGSNIVSNDVSGRGMKLSSKLPMLQEQQKEQMLNTTGDICGGRGGELGRRLEAWLTTSGNVDEDRARWANSSSCVDANGNAGAEKIAVDVETG